MILFPPAVFDSNEWFIVAASVLVWTVSLALPKRFSLFTVVCIWVLNIYLAQTTDFIIGKVPYELYQVNDYSEYEYFDVFLYIITYPPAAYLMLEGYDRWRLRGSKAVFYVLACALVTIGLERVSVAFRVFTYDSWRLAYSYPTYVLVYSLNIGMLRLVRRYHPLQGLRADRPEQRQGRL